MKWGLARLNEADFALSTVFDDFFRMVPADLLGSEVFPKLDVHEDDKAVHVKAEIPGLDEKDLNVTLKENMLTIAGEKKEEKTEEDKSRNYYYCERSFGSFSRTIVLPEGIKADEVKANYKNGILDIELPKEEAAQPKKINVEVH
ncbi:MAG TPA: Hsp20/alpha crystallin family protein [Spirochaetota bacterium]|mgnify:FL=1|nr:Hsp20/alpha crystallin family protein [Spirochaetota bacterium]HPC41479.1 Hsp20/alpha crystallin family protein [Spirochaetota bacterium]HPL19335.1 Hsp20/alpha crystallin family protein [Spirochaetota bacterium]HQF09153.1 Hsp20/alpha crystallin family protein [Spirochaetota bacterium]HQH97622.1 Hsp20/alpha crystallin family protein [Spirochaetota bacterium]